LLSGTGAVLFSLVLTKMVTDWFAGREIVFAMGVFLASWPFGIALGLLMQAALAAQLGWQAVMHGTAALCAVALVLIGAVYRSPPGSAAAPSATTAPRLAWPPAGELLPTAIAGTLWGSLNLGLIVFFSFVPPLLVEQGIAPLAAASLTSTALWISIISVPLGGYLVERSGRPDAAIALSCCIAAMALAALACGRLPALLCVIVGLSIAPAGAVMALPARVLSAAHRPIGFGVFYTAHYTVIGFGPGLAGVARDVSGTAAAATLFGAAFFAVGAPLLWAFKRFAAASRA
jgi:predicted MFS family arabinose efflux permease